MRRESAQGRLPEARASEQSARQLDFGPGRLPQGAHRQPDFRAGRCYWRPEPEAAGALIAWGATPSPGMPSYSSPASSVARTWKQGVIMGQYSPITHGWPYSWMLDQLTLSGDTFDH